MPILLNWIWQGSALTCLVALVAGRRRGLNAATRERIWWATLGAVCLMPVVSTLGSTLGITPSAALPTRGAPLAIIVEPTGAAVAIGGSIWALWLTISLIRIIGALVALCRAKQSASPFPTERFDGLAAWRRVSSEGRRATLVVSDRVSTAAVLGLGRPLVAVSPDALGQLNDEELDAILVHEYGHVQRRDDLGVLLQRIVSAVSGLHPAVWWLDRALTFEREVACDDLVLATARSTPRRYARSLVKLVELARTQGGLQLAPGAILRRPQLTRRIVRLLDGQRNASVTPSRSTLGFALSAIAILALVAMSVELVALAAPTLAARSMAAALIEPFVSARAVPDLSLAPTMGGAKGPARQTSAAATVTPAAERPVSEEESGATGAMTAAVSDHNASDLLPADLLDVTVLAPVSHSTSPGVPGRAGDTTTPSARAHASPEAPAPWAHAADAASAIGRGTREGAIKTAGVFARIGKSVAGAF